MRNTWMRFMASYNSIKFQTSMTPIFCFIFLNSFSLPSVLPSQLPTVYISVSTVKWFSVLYSQVTFFPPLLCLVHGIKYYALAKIWKSFLSSGGLTGTVGTVVMKIFAWNSFFCIVFKMFSKFQNCWVPDTFRTVFFFFFVKRNNKDKKNTKKIS